MCRVFKRSLFSFNFQNTLNPLIKRLVAAGATQYCIKIASVAGLLEINWCNKLILVSKLPDDILWMVKYFLLNFTVVYYIQYF